MRSKWIIPVAVLGGLLLLVVLPLMGSYNGLVDKEEGVDQSFADLDAQLQRRNDLIPNLVAAVQGALQQEQAVFGEIARARQNYAGAESNEERLEAANEVSGAIGRLLVIVESYPDLKSNQNIQDLQVQLEGTENRITVARGRFIASVAAYNGTVLKFPTSIGAKIRGKNERPTFTATTPGADRAPQVEL